MIRSPCIFTVLCAIMQNIFYFTFFFFFLLCWLLFLSSCVMLFLRGFKPLTPAWLSCNPHISCWIQNLVSQDLWNASNRSAAGWNFFFSFFKRSQSAGVDAHASFPQHSFKQKMYKFMFRFWVIKKRAFFSCADFVWSKWNRIVSCLCCCRFLSLNTESNICLIWLSC